jgi:ABC-type dipeptide/oligopeptide/nickel transport system permease component
VWYILRRSLFGLIVVFAVVTITFVLSHHLGGNIIISWLGKDAVLHPALAAQYEQIFHLNQPIWVQYYYYIIGIAQGNLGYSPSRDFQPVTSVIAATLPFTLQLVIFAFIVTIALGVCFGILSARYHHTPVDVGIRAFYLAGFSATPFFIGLLLLLLFSFVLRILPSGGAYSPTLPFPRTITGFPLLDSLIEGDWSFFFSSVEHLILPGLALALVTFGVIARILRSSLLEVMNTNYIRTAKSKGLGENSVLFRHALKNALIPVITLSPIALTWLISGTIFVENVFSYPGLGQYLVGALSGQDYPGILGATLVFAVTIVIGNLIADMLYAFVDPQVRLGG